MDGRNNLARVILKSLLSDYGGGGGQTLKFCNTNDSINNYEVNKNSIHCTHLYIFCLILLGFERAETLKNKIKRG